MAATGQLKPGYNHSPFQTAVLTAGCQTQKTEVGAGLNEATNYVNFHYLM